MTIMVVDSDQTALQKAADVLTKRRAAITVVLQQSAVKAAEFAMCNAVDILFARIELPDMSGEELLEKVKRLQPITECHLLKDGEEIIVTPRGEVMVGVAQL